MLSLLRRTAIAGSLAVLSFSAVFAQQPSAATASRIDDLLSNIHRSHSVAQLAVSPNGKRLAWIEQGQIFVAPLNDLNQRRRVTATSTPSGACREYGLAWSPDSSALAFLSNCLQPGGPFDLFLSHLYAASPSRLTSLDGYATSPAFSPDGKSIAFLYVPGANRPAGATAAQDDLTGVIGEQLAEIERVAWVSASASQPAAPTLATPANLHVYEFDWSPDSRSLAYIAADPPGEDNWWVAKLYTQPLGGAALPILSPAQISGPLHGLQIAVPRWSPDGKSIAFIGGLMSDQGVTGGDVWLLPSTGGLPVNLTPNRPSSAAWIAWDGSRDLFFGELAGSNCQLVRLHLAADPQSGEFAAGSAQTIFHRQGDIGDGRNDLNFSPTADRSLFVFVGSSFERAPEIYALQISMPANTGSAATLADEISTSSQLSHINDNLQPVWGKSVSIDWPNEGFHLQGWLLLPAHYDPAQKYPLLVVVHGGPAYANRSSWGVGDFDATVFSALDDFVFLPNPRGSFGQGEAMTQANRKDFGYGDLRDILAGVDAVQASYPADPNRLAIAGWSYGGFMAMFAPTQTHRFRASVAGAGISNWLSYYGENSIDQWMIPYFGASVYDAPDLYARGSAIQYIKNSITPTLLLVGDSDGECPAPQSFEYWHALRDLHVPTRLVVYPNEGHGIANPANRRDILLRSIDWLARYLPPTP
jgi:dipeptidyl aminopeptidase/acylaminoacyl peptidase